MDRELDTWLDDVMAKQQYRDGLTTKRSICGWLHKITFGSKVKAQ